MNRRIALISSSAVLLCAALAGCSASGESTSATPSPAASASAAPSASVPSPSAPASTPSASESLGEKKSPDAVATELSRAGLSEDEAVALIEKAGLTHRVVARDGELFPVTADYSPSRLNLFIEGGVVTSVSTG